MIRCIAVLALSLVCADASANGGLAVVAARRTPIRSFFSRPVVVAPVVAPLRVQRFVAPVVVSPYVQRQLFVPQVQSYVAPLVVPQVQAYVAPQAYVVPQVQAFAAPCSSAAFFVY